MSIILKLCSICFDSSLHHILQLSFHAKKWVHTWKKLYYIPNSVIINGYFDFFNDILDAGQGNKFL